MTSPAKTYACAMCKETFEEGRNEEEAIAEMKENFGDIPEGKRAIICDDCYQAVTIGGKPILFN